MDAEIGKEGEMKVNREFQNRINVQRTVLEHVNFQMELKEPLFGLTHKSIFRWIRSNDLDDGEELVTAIFEISEKLFFLGTKSQDAVTKKYGKVSSDVFDLINRLLLFISQRSLKVGDR